MSSSNQPLRHEQKSVTRRVLFLLRYLANLLILRTEQEAKASMPQPLSYIEKGFPMSYQDLKDCKMITAFITPFHEDGSINFKAIPPLIEHLLAHHTDGILLAGTTAESPTLTHDEELELFAAVQKVVNGRVPLIAGVGTNETRDSIEFVKEVDQFGGFAAGLAIVPYYNKPSQEGMYQHFKAIADASNLPIIIYNIPGRVVVEMTPETMLRLAEHPNIIGVKECTTLANMAYLIEHKPEEFLIYTGEDGDAFHAMNLGADGVISVASHTNGDEMHEMFQAIENNDIKKAAAIQRQFIPKVNALFSYPSPAPVKAVLNYMGFEAGPTRLPLVPAPAEEAKRIIKVVVDGDYHASKEIITGVLRPDY